MSRRARVVLAALSWAAGIATVRLGLDWADTFPYTPASEVRYRLVAGVALAVAVGGTLVSVLARRRPRASPRRRRDR